MIRRKILSLAWPAVCEMMLYMLLDFVDVAFVGRLGAQSLAAVGLGAQIYFSILFIFCALSAGATALIARAVGAKDPERAGKTAGHALSLAVLIGIAVTVSVYLFTDVVVGLFRFEAGVRQLAAVYIKTTGSVAAFGMVLFISNGIFRGAGLTKIPFYIAALTNVVNIAGDYVLIFGKCGFPALGVRGAAIATASAQVTGCVVMVVLLISGATMVRVRPGYFFRFRDRELTGVILKLSAPAGIEEAVMNLGRLVGSFMLAGLGTVPFATHQVILTAESLSYMPGYGFAVAATSLVGQNLGARKPKRAYQHGMIAARLALMVMGVIALVFLVFPSVIIRIFTSDPQVVGLGALCLRIAAIEQPAIALELVLAGALRGAGDTRTPAMITTLCTWLLRIPLMYLSIYVFHWGLTAIWIITVIDWVVRASLVIIQFRRGKWQQIAL